MQILFYSTQAYDRKYFESANAAFGFQFRFLDFCLNEENAALVKQETVICIFVNDVVNAATINILKTKGVKLIALRCAGFNNVDLEAAALAGIQVVRVPAYSPHAVAEHAVALLLTLNRHTHRAYNRVRDYNFTLNGLEGYDLYQKTVGVVGTGHIGAVFANIMRGFGCRVLAYDVARNAALEQAGVEYVSLEKLWAESDVISLHCPLNSATDHIINADSIAKMKPGVTIINTSRGALVDTKAVMDGLKSLQIGALGIDVYEQEEQLFFQDLSGSIIDDEVIKRLMTFPNVLITAHQGFFTKEALTKIAGVTLSNIRSFEKEELLVNKVEAK